MKIELNLPAPSEKRLEALCATLDCTLEEVLKDSLRIFEWHVERDVAGKKLYELQEDGSYAELVVFTN